MVNRSRAGPGKKQQPEEPKVALPPNPVVRKPLGEGPPTSAYETLSAQDETTDLAKGKGSTTGSSSTEEAAKENFLYHDQSTCGKSYNFFFMLNFGTVAKNISEKHMEAQSLYQSTCLSVSE